MTTILSSVPTTKVLGGCHAVASTRLPICGATISVQVLVSETLESASVSFADNKVDRPLACPGIRAVSRRRDGY